MELISAQYLVAESFAPLANGAIIVDDGKIVAVGERADLTARYPNLSAQHHHEHHVLMPGLINAHIHPDLASFVPDTPEKKPTPDMSLFTHWHKQALEFRSRVRLDQLAASIRTTLGRSIQYGITTLGLSTSYDACAELVEPTGLRAVVFPEVHAAKAGEASQDRFESALAVIEQHLDTPHDLIGFGLAPLAPYLLSRQGLSILSRHAVDLNIPVQIHAAESFDEMEFFFNASGPIGAELFPMLGWGPEHGQSLPPAFQKTPIKYLEEVGVLAAATAIIGVVQLGVQDIPVLLKHRCTVVHCPSAVRALQLGEFPMGKLLEKGVPIALGTESHLLPSDGDLWAEMKVLLTSGGLSPAQILTMATSGGARALRLDGRTGALAAGKSADYLVVETPPCPDVHFLLDALIRHTTSNRIRQVVVDGQILKSTL